MTLNLAADLILVVLLLLVMGALSIPFPTALGVKTPAANTERQEPTENLVVKEIDQGRATLMVRADAAAKAASAHLIVWGSGKQALEKTYHDLGSRPATTFGEELVDEFLAIATERLRQLASTADADSSAPPASTEEAAASAPPAEGKPAETPEKPNPDSAIKLIKFPSIARGTIIEVGYMPKPTPDGVKDCFGVRYRSDEGIEGVEWGVDLKRALKGANASVGDRVEMLKVGRKTLEKGKAPMNMWQIAKL